MFIHNISSDIKIFDSLTHIKEDGSWYDTDINSSMDRLLEQFDSSNLSKSLLVGMPGDNHEFLIDIAKKYNNRFIPISAIEFDNDASKEKLEKKILRLKTAGFKGIKIHPRLLKTNLNDDRISESISLANKHDIVSLVCTVHRHPSLPLKRPLSDAIHELCLRNSESKIILLHGGYYDLLATSEHIRNFENVLLDLSATIMRFKDTHIMQDIVYLFKSFDKRMCIGSDFPEFTIADVVNVVENHILKQHDIDEEKVKNIFFNNLNFFFGE